MMKICAAACAAPSVLTRPTHALRAETSRLATDARSAHLFESGAQHEAGDEIILLPTNCVTGYQPKVVLV